MTVEIVHYFLKFEHQALLIPPLLPPNPSSESFLVHCGWEGGGGGAGTRIVEHNLAQSPDYMKQNWYK